MTGQDAGTDVTDGSHADGSVGALPTHGSQDPDTVAPTRRPGMHDVARVAGVSHQTVSRVLNNHPNVRPETRERVQAAIEHLGYRRNSAARALVTRRTDAIGVITEDSPLHGPTMTLMALENAARKDGMNVSVATVTQWDVPSVQASLRHFEEQDVDGVVVIASHDEAVRAIQGYTHRIPVVMAGPSDLGDEVYTAAANQYSGARLATRHLIDLGHTDIVHVTGPSVWLDARSRARGWVDAMRQNGLDPADPIPGDWRASTGYQIGVELVADRVPTAIFAGNDQLALGLLHAFAEAGLRVPRDVSVVGFDDVEGSAHFFPPLTTVAPDFGALGRRCLDQMRAAIDGAPAVPGLVSARLRVRSSTSAPRSER